MTCIRFGNAIITFSPTYRLPLRDGTRIYMDWHHYCGPTFFRDRHCTREVDKWWDDPRIIEALNWFIGRGEKA